MISEEKEGTTFKMIPEVEDSRVGCLKFTVECGIALLSGVKFGREKGKRLPMMRNLLLKDTTNVEIRGVSG